MARERVAFLGGGRREAAAAARLRAAGLETVEIRRAAGWDESAAARALARAEALVLPVASVGARLEADEDGKPAWSLDGLLEHLPGGAPLLFGRRPEGAARPLFERLARDHPLHPLLERDDFAWLNAVPTAEGAVVAAAEQLERTIRGSRALVLGYGRTGSTLARLLAAMGARTLVLARSPAARAQARAAGHEAAPVGALSPALAGEADLLFNTVPAPLLTPDLFAVRPELPVLDLASAPGGLHPALRGRPPRGYRLLPALPERYAPASAGEALAQVLLEILRGDGERG
ncbi:MAG: dipicolinic acid synthetase subunit A [Firmicutes bacterium]|nr:dipicolinic acid synthetase subunit A [Bacillota bacterium]